MGDDDAVDDPAAPSRPPEGGGERSARAGAWAVPGSAEAQPQPALGDPGPRAVPGAEVGRGPGWGAARGEASGRVVEPAVVPRVALRPMTSADVLDGAFMIIKARPARIMGIAALFVVPTQLVVAYLQRTASGGLGLASLVSGDPTVIDPAASNTGPDGETILALVLSLVIPAIALVCVAAAIAHLVSQWIVGRDASAGEMLGVVGRRLWPLLGSFVLVKFLEGLGAVVCYLGIVFVMPLFVPVAPIIAVEGEGPVSSITRSFRLIRSLYFRVMGLALLMALVSLLLGTALSALPQVLAAEVGFERGWPLLALGSIVSQVIVMPFVAAATVLLYFDLRVRNEGLDLEMTAVDVFDRAA